MPLSKARDSERKRLEKVRLESNLTIPENVQPDVIPWYNSQVHKAGDRVRVNVRGRVQVVTVPELDGDGHPMPF